MKCRKQFAALAIASAMILAGCGEGGADVVHPTDFAEPIESSSTTNTTEDSSVAESQPEKSESEEVIVDIPPEEGLVHSSLTNEWVSEEVQMSRPIAVMFPTDKVAQPQYGIGSCGVLYEIMEEGGISRQMGIIENWQSLEKIGNIRSCREYYVFPAMEWDSIIVCFGGPYYLADEMNRSEVEYIAGAQIGAGENTAPALGNGAFYREGPNSAPHNAYTSGKNLVKTFDQLGYQLEHRDFYYYEHHFKYAPMDKGNDLSQYSEAEDAYEINLSQIFPYTESAFEYDESTGTYLKYLHGKAQVDELTGEQLSFANVIVQSTDWGYEVDNTYLRFFMNSNEGEQTLKGWYFTQGKVIPITWTKSHDYALTQYYDLDGNEIQLNTGKTYIAVAQIETVPLYE